MSNEDQKEMQNLNCNEWLQIVIAIIIGSLQMLDGQTKVAGCMSRDQRSTSDEGSR